MDAKVKIIKPKNGVVGKVSGRKKLTAVEIAPGATEIQGATFSECTLLESVVLPEGLTMIQSSAFEGCTGLRSIVLPSSVKTIGDNAFSKCSGLTEIALNEGLEQVGGRAFMGCSSLKRVVIPSTVQRVGDLAFRDCSGVEEVIVSGGTEFGWSVFKNCTSLASVSISKDVVRISPEMFAGCSSLKKMDVPEGVEVIGTDAFAGCDGLELHLPKSVKMIEEHAFKDCLDAQIEGRVMVKFWPHPFNEDQHVKLMQDFENEGSDLANSCGMNPDATKLVDIAVLDQPEVADGLYWYDDPSEGFSWQYRWFGAVCAAEGALA